MRPMSTKAKITLVAALVAALTLAAPVVFISASAWRRHRDRALTLSRLNEFANKMRNSRSVLEAERRLFDRVLNHESDPRAEGVTEGYESTPILDAWGHKLLYRR